jgi:type IV pilus assembly protein PilM
MTEQIGIEISSSAVRIAVVERKGTRTQLVGWAEAPLSPGAVIDGGIGDERSVFDALVAAARMAKVARRPLGSPRRVRLAVSGLRAITRQVELPPMPDAEMEAAARLQALEVVPFPADKTLLCARRLRSPGRDSETSVLLEVAHRDLVEPLVSVVAKAGFVVEAVELSATALVRALGDTSTGPEAIVSIGAELTTLVVHEQGEVRFVRTIAAGGASVTRALASSLEVTLDEAEAIKVGLGSATGIASTVPAEAAAAARDASAVLLSEIRSSILYYSSLPGALEVGRVVLVGGGAELWGFADRLQFQMAAPVVHRSCLDALGRVRVAVDPSALAQRSPVAVGLALAPGGKKAPPGLLPPEVLRARHHQRVERAVLAGVGAVLLAAAAAGAARYVQVRHARQAVAALQSSIGVLERDMPSYDKAQALQQAALADARLAEPLVSNEVAWPAVLGELETFTPSSVSTLSLTGSTGAAPAGATTAGATSAAGTLSTPTSSPPAAISILGSVSLSLSGTSYPAFRAWFDSLSGSRYFQVVQFSGLTSSSNRVNFSAQLNLTGLLRSNRLRQFEGLLP